jgi:hypothetical protein
MKTVLVLLTICASLAFAGERQDDSKPLVLPNLPAPQQTPTKTKFTNDCSANKNVVLPGKSGFEKCTVQDSQLREGVTK